MKFKDAMQACLKEFLKEYKTPYDVNNGACEDFMQCVTGKVPKAEERVTEEMVGGDTELPGHIWIFYKEKHYDAETPNGVKDWRELPIFRKILLRNEKVTSQIEDILHGNKTT